MKKNILVYETKELGEVKKIERAKEEDIEKYLISKGMSESEAKDAVAKLMNGEIDGITLREINVKRRVMKAD